MLEALRMKVKNTLGVRHSLPVLTTGPRRKITLTLDDGPTPAATPKILDLLDRHNTRATFFLLGSRAERWPMLVQSIAEAGHPVYAHGYSHVRMDELSPEAVIEELDRTEASLSRFRATPSPYLLRLPYGSGHHCERVHRLLRSWRADCQIVHWRYDMKDFLLANGCGSDLELRERCCAKVSQALASRRLPGSIMLMHEDPLDVDAPLASAVGPLLLEELLLGASQAGLQIAPLEPRCRPASRQRPF